LLQFENINMKKSQPIYYVNGKYLPKNEAKINVDDLGLLRGYGVFDYLVTYQGGRPFLIKKHIKRLYNSARLIDLRISYKPSFIEKLVIRTINKNKNGEEKAVRIVITGGESENAISPAKKSTIIISVNTRKMFSESFYKNGATVITFDFKRESPQTKSLNYIQAVKANALAKIKGAVEAIYVDKENNKLFEGTTSNVFLVKNRKIVTPDGQTLPGITREMVMKICRKFYPTTMRDVEIKELLSADEIFLSSSNKEIMPVVKVDNKIIGNGVPGEITNKIRSEFRKFIDQGNW